MSSHNTHLSLVQVAGTSTTDPAGQSEHMRKTGCSYRVMIIHGFKRELFFF